MLFIYSTRSNAIYSTTSNAIYSYTATPFFDLSRNIDYGIKSK